MENSGNNCYQSLARVPVRWNLIRHTRYYQLCLIIREILIKTSQTQYDKNLILSPQFDFRNNSIID